MIPQWLLPPKPELTGKVREISQAEEFRIAKYEFERAFVQDAAAEREKNLQKRIARMKERHERRRQEIAAECLRRGETMQERRARMKKESRCKRIQERLGLRIPKL